MSGSLLSEVVLKGVRTGSVLWHDWVLILSFFSQKVNGFINNQNQRKGDRHMPLEIVRNDITKMKTDAIVNAANSSLKMGGGVCGAIFQAAGPQALQEACDRIGHCAVGRAVYTDAFTLAADFIIHTVKTAPLCQIQFSLLTTIA